MHTYLNMNLSVQVLMVYTDTSILIVILQKKMDNVISLLMSTAMIKIATSCSTYPLTVPLNYLYVYIFGKKVCS